MNFDWFHATQVEESDNHALFFECKSPHFSIKNTTETRPRQKHSTGSTMLSLVLAQPKEQPRLLQQLSRFYLLPFPRKKLGYLRTWTPHVFHAISGIMNYIIAFAGPTISRYPEPGKSNLLHPIPFIQDTNECKFATYSKVFQVISFLQVSPPIPCALFSSSPYFPHTIHSNFFDLISLTLFGGKYINADWEVLLYAVFFSHLLLPPS